MSMNDLVSAIVDASGVPGMRLRQGTIVSTNGSSCTVTIAGSTTQITGVSYASHVCPIPGATCWLATDGRDWFVLATLAPNGAAWATMRKSTAQTIATAAFTELNWASRTDTAAVGMTLGSAGITVVVPGVYSVTGNIVWSANSAGNRHSQLLKNGVVISQADSCVNLPSQLVRQSASGITQCAAGDVLNIAGYQNSGAGLATDVASGACVISATWIGPST